MKNGTIQFSQRNRRRENRTKQQIAIIFPHWREERTIKIIFFAMQMTVCKKRSMDKGKILENFT